MSGGDSKLRAALAAPGLLFALYQCWYVYLPADEAVAFAQCRFNAHLDCFKSLHRQGLEMGLPVFPMLAGVYLLMNLLLGAGALAREPRQAAWRGWAAVLSIPAAGLSIYVLMNDIVSSPQGGTVTSLSTVLLLGIGIALCLLTVLQPLPTRVLAQGGGGLLGFTTVAIAAGALLHLAGYARLVAADIELERQGEPAQLRWSRFAWKVPRVGAAHLGEPTAAHDLLLVVDPKQPESRALMQSAARLQDKLGDRVVIYIYAPQDSRLLQSFIGGQLDAFLEDPDSYRGPPGDPSIDFRRQQSAIRELGLTAFPAVIWRGGQRTGVIDLEALLGSLSRS